MQKVLGVNLLCVCLCVSCAPGSRSGVAGKPDQSTQDTLAGLDQDQNGIRDDVDTLLKEHYQDPVDVQFFPAAQAVARVFQEVATEETWTRERAAELAEKINLA